MKGGKVPKKAKRSAKIAQVLVKIRECIEADRYVETIHFQLRKLQRNIDFQDVLFVLLNGRHEARKDQYDESFQSWNYAIRGRSLDDEEIRVVISFDDEGLLIITAFYLNENV